LRKDCKICGEYASVPRLGSFFELLPSESVGGVIGRALDCIYVDEGCLVNDETFAVLMPSIVAKQNCKLVCVSSSWAPKGFFYELVQDFEKSSDPQVFMFRSDRKDLNKFASMENLDFMSKMLIKINPAYEKRFLSTEFAEIGDEFLPRNMVDSCIDYTLINKTESKGSCYAFLDL
jgi:hypothetical protein